MLCILRFKDALVMREHVSNTVNIDETPLPFLGVFVVSPDEKTDWENHFMFNIWFHFRSADVLWQVITVLMY